MYATTTPQDSGRYPAARRRNSASAIGAKSQFREEDYVPFPQSHDIIRRHTIAEESQFREEDYVPFPQSHDIIRRRTSTTPVFKVCGDGKRPQRRLSNSLGEMEERRPSLLASLRDTFRGALRRGSNNSDNSDDVPSEISTAVSSGPSSESHYSWANADEINAQTGIFNQKSSAKLREKMTRRNSTSVCSSQPDEPSPRQLPRRRRSFTFGQKIGKDDESIDVESQLWDDFVDENASAITCDEGKAIRTVAW
jgi:hypothetical protein